MQKYILNFDKSIEKILYNDKIINKEKQKYKTAKEY